MTHDIIKMFADVMFETNKCIVCDSKKLVLFKMLNLKYIYVFEVLINVPGVPKKSTPV